MMKKILGFFYWLRVDWHISYIAAAFFGVAYTNTDGNLVQMIVFSRHFSDYLFWGVLLELVLRRRKLFSKSHTIPK